MITAWDIYWITRLDSINLLLGIIFSFIIVTTAIIGVALFAIQDDTRDSNYWKKMKRIAVWLAGITLVIGSILAAIPSTKEAVTIYMIPKIANNEEVQKLPDNAMKFLNGKFEEWINDMAGKGKKK